MNLKVGKRDLGKNSTLRKDGLIPAELYGKGIENIHLAVEAKEFSKVFKEAGENTVINLEIDGSKHPALIYDVDRHPLDGTVRHIDFYKVRMDEKIVAKIPVEFVGEPPAVKEKGGVLNRNVSEIEVEALPADLPHRLTADLSGLIDIDQSLYVKDIPVPKGVTIKVPPDMAIATITPPLKEEVVEVKPMDVSEVKVETEEKKAEREENKEPAAE